MTREVRFSALGFPRMSIVGWGRDVISNVETHCFVLPTVCTIEIDINTKENEVSNSN